VRLQRKQDHVNGAYEFNVVGSGNPDYEISDRATDANAVLPDRAKVRASRDQSHVLT